VEPIDPRGVGSRTQGPADPALFCGLVDDAAVFPPGLAPLGRAVSDHLSRTRYAGLVGPLIVPATAAGELAALACGWAAARPRSARPSSRPLRVALVARPGASDLPVWEGVRLLARQPGVEVAGVEVGWSTHWRDLLGLRVPVTVEIPREGHAGAMADVGAAAHDAPSASAPLVQAKLRTGATPTWAWPDERELARFVQGCVDHDLRFKLTGGLHHAVRGDHPAGGGGEPQHGLLNVLVAVRSALQGGREADLVPLLAERDLNALVPDAAGMAAEEAGAVRACFTAYGCCTVSDPIGELAALGLLGEE